MTLRSEIRAILVAGPKTAAQLAELCASATDEKQVAQNLSTLKGLGMLKISGTVEGRNSYAIANWPEKRRSGDAPPAPKKSARAKRGKKGSREQATEDLAAPPAPNGSGADEFAITDSGVLAIKQGTNAIQILPDSFARLRKFIERAEQIFNPTE